MVTVCFPFRAGCPYREKSFKLVKEKYREILPDSLQFEVDTDHEEFSRAASRNKCASLAGDGVVVIADTDIIPNKSALLSAIEGAKNGGMHLGYSEYRYLSEMQSELVYLGHDCSTLKHDWSSTASQCGIVVMRVDEWFRAGGMDERFKGWGWEDTAFACAVETLIGKIKYHQGNVYHLFHPTSFVPGSQQQKDSEKLFSEYRAASGNKEAMLQLIQAR